MLFLIHRTHQRGYLMEASYSGYRQAINLIMLPGNVPLLCSKDLGKDEDCSGEGITNKGSRFGDKDRRLSIKEKQIRLCASPSRGMSTEVGEATSTAGFLTLWLSSAHTGQR
ncbi:hypothetical protein Tcan_18619 [Toxocara canis]|uniref:Uncharacterized protein n=2 Tax=Toxocara canis TaxID=6265 RepID=A0A0B2V2Z7_TOXCA|nr:hypothetical protein Tcan_18619 [Toxocara canis]VDM26047.1 unnamed protein product [Toxocara canis]